MTTEPARPEAVETTVRLQSAIIRLRKGRAWSIVAALVGLPGLFALVPNVTGSARQGLGIAFTVLSLFGVVGGLFCTALILQYRSLLRELD